MDNVYYNVLLRIQGRKMGIINRGTLWTEAHNVKPRAAYLTLRKISVRVFRAQWLPVDSRKFVVVSNVYRRSLKRTGIRTIVVAIVAIGLIR